ncbi:sel1 repeat family protein [Geomonas nitrogeniifigens]|uniref:Sel1 repeat family protein n=1 Tax=Geomonas diazotrophica TaxID=2843197 RepID=A0ABX8JDZ7_9BACT|nr:tetratricopeptide repeat protein [Geomonas nitrogeniifigens]QWV96528.1 sel1 repeat family protein [Geomonas nitrogeniifigens]
MKATIVLSLIVVTSVFFAPGARADAENSCQPVNDSVQLQFRKTIIPSSHNDQAADGTQQGAYYSELSEAGDAAVANNLGVDRMKGQHITLNFTEGFNNFCIAARQSNMEAQYNLGVAYLTGKGVRKDMVNAALWFQKAALQGDTEAQYIAGIMYEYGCGFKQNYAEATKWYRKASEKWHIQAQECLTRLYLAGKALPVDSRVANRWQALARSKGSAAAAFETATEISGKANDCNKSEIAVLLRAAAELGHVQAAYLLGSLFDKHHNGHDNTQEALKWYQIGARQGHVQSQYDLGLLYSHADSGALDLVKAYVWLDFAALNGMADAAAKRDSITKTMSRTEFYAAQRLKREMIQFRELQPKRETRQVPLQ